MHLKVCAIIIIILTIRIKMACTVEENEDLAHVDSIWMTLRFKSAKHSIYSTVQFNKHSVKIK